MVSTESAAHMCAHLTYQKWAASRENRPYFFERFRVDPVTGSAIARRFASIFGTHGYRARAQRLLELMYLDNSGSFDIRRSIGLIVNALRSEYVNYKSIRKFGVRYITRRASLIQSVTTAVSYFKKAVKLQVGGSDLHSGIQTEILNSLMSEGYPNKFLDEHKGIVLSNRMYLGLNERGEPDAAFGANKKKRRAPRKKIFFLRRPAFLLQGKERFLDRAIDGFFWRKDLERATEPFALLTAKGGKHDALVPKSEIGREWSSRLWSITSTRLIGTSLSDLPYRAGLSPDAAVDSAKVALSLLPESPEFSRRLLLRLGAASVRGRREHDIFKRALAAGFYKRRGYLTVDDYFTLFAEKIINSTRESVRQVQNSGAYDARRMAGALLRREELFYSAQ